MKLFGWVEKWINEHGSASIMEKRLALKDDEIAKLKAQIKDLETAQQKQQIEADEIRVHSGIEFHRGKSTGGEWVPFCPKCKIPAMLAEPWNVMCSARCGWSSSVKPMDVPNIISEL
jgi:hypothetical protein